MKRNLKQRGRKKITTLKSTADCYMREKGGYIVRIGSRFLVNAKIARYLAIERFQKRSVSACRR